MKIAKLLRASQELLGDKKSKSSERKRCLKEIQRKLKKKSQRLKEKIENEQNKKNKKILIKYLAVIYTQRKKVIKALKELKQKN